MDSSKAFFIDIVFLYVKINSVIYLKINKSLRGLALSALFTAVLAVCSWISLPAPVPFTLQTLGVFLTVGLLGFKGSFISIAAYLLLGAVGLPVFSSFRGGFGVLLGPTGGYALAFLLVPFIYWGVLRLTRGKYLFAAMLSGLSVCYALGALWYSFFAGGESFLSLLAVTVAPFILPDILKLGAALIIIKRIGKFICP